GHFDFTEADGSVYTAVENTTGVIPFQVTNITCNGNFPFVVGFKLPNDKKVDDDCIIFLNSTDKHPCLNISRTGEYQYELRKTFDRSDNGVMIVLSAIDKIQTRNITLDIHYPARVTSLNITQSTNLTDLPVEPNSLPKFAETVFKRSLNPSDTESTISLDFRAHTGDIEECRMKKLESSSTNGLDEDCLRQGHDVRAEGRDDHPEMHMQNGLLDDLGERRVFVNKVLHEGLGHQDGAAAPLYANEAACSSSPLRSTAANLLGTRESGGGSEYDDYAEVCDKEEKTNTVQKKLPRARNSRRIPAIADEEDDDYAEVDGDVGKKTSERGKQGRSLQFCDMHKAKAASDDDTYVDIADIRKRKAEKREKRLVVLEGATAVDEDTYVPISEILDRKKQAENTAPKDESNKDDPTRPVS
ncbi:hypothetical protein BaRGS_00038635, partial [Batillaria attramentaria]